MPTLVSDSVPRGLRVNLNDNLLEDNWNFITAGGYVIKLSADIIKRVKCFFWAYKFPKAKKKKKKEFCKYA